MSPVVLVEGRFLALTVIGKNSEDNSLPFPSDSVFTWDIDNPVIATISEITPGDGTIRKIAPKSGGGHGSVKVTCTITFRDVYDNNQLVTITNTFTVLVGEDLPTSIGFEAIIEDNP